MKRGEADRRSRGFPALVAALGIGPLLGLGDRLRGENAVPERQPASIDMSISPRANSPATISK